MSFYLLFDLLPRTILYGVLLFCMLVKRRKRKKYNNLRRSDMINADKILSAVNKAETTISHWEVKIARLLSKAMRQVAKYATQDEKSQISHVFATLSQEVLK